MIARHEIIPDIILVGRIAAEIEKISPDYLPSEIIKTKNLKLKMTGNAVMLLNELFEHYDLEPNKEETKEFFDSLIMLPHFKELFHD